jgi:hypothetical protein
MKKIVLTVAFPVIVAAIALAALLTFFLHSS